MLCRCTKCDPDKMVKCLPSLPWHPGMWVSCHFCYRLPRHCRPCPTVMSTRPRAKKRRRSATNPETLHKTRQFVALLGKPAHSEGFARLHLRCGLRIKGSRRCPALQSNLTSSSLQEGLGNLQPVDVLTLLLVEGQCIDEVTDLVVHANLGKVLVQRLLKLVVQVLKVWAVVAADAVPLLRVHKGLQVANHIAVVLAGLGAAVEGNS